jgi:hypothetical protein
MRRGRFIAGTIMFFGLAQNTPTEGTYRLLKTVRVGGQGAFDTAFTDNVGRRLYIPRRAPVGSQFSISIPRNQSARSRRLPQRRRYRCKVRAWIREQQTCRDVGRQDFEDHQDN